MKKTVSGNLNFQMKDPLMARFKLEPAGKKDELDILSKRVIEISPTSLFPADFDSMKYDVTGEYSFTVEVTEKKKPKK